MGPVKEQTPENRPTATGPLGVVQEFLNSGHLDAAGRFPAAILDDIRTRHENGSSQASLATEYVLNQGFVSAILRRVPLDDELRPPHAAGDWLAERGLLAPGSAVSATGLERLIELRELLRHLAAANNGHPLEPEVLPALNRIAAAAPLVVRFQSHSEAGLAPAVDGIDGAIGRLLAMVFAAMSDGTWQRLKRCPGTGCPATFYDASRNRTGTWCAMSVCGNRTKVRKYQQRKRVARA
jgi:predicted RNA-binding Zn ribbon-like protein